VAMIGRT